MPKLKVLSGGDVIKILELFDFAVVSQKGSHVKLRRTINKINQNITIPNHKELDKGTLKAILNQASKYISESELMPHFYNE
ncbi:MAG: type II toxin-antitoxin system HicA family toxin [Candidatus Paceibacterota bacterium]